MILFWENCFAVLGNVNKFTIAIAKQVVWGKENSNEAWQGWRRKTLTKKRPSTWAWKNDWSERVCGNDLTKVKSAKSRVEMNFFRSARVSEARQEKANCRLIHIETANYSVFNSSYRLNMEEKRSSYKERKGDALAPGADEGRSKLRKAAGSRKQTLIRGCPNGETHRESCPGTVWWIK